MTPEMRKIIDGYCDQLEQQAWRHENEGTFQPWDFFGANALLVYIEWRGRVGRS